MVTAGQLSVSRSMLSVVFRSFTRTQWLFGLSAVFWRVRRHFSLQYLTSFHTFCHFLRHLRGRAHTGQGFSGRLGFLCAMIVFRMVAIRAAP